ncbi:MAG: zinc ribbon domain-containing protein [Promethearchaeota archaeon]
MRVLRKRHNLIKFTLILFLTLYFLANLSINSLDLNNKSIGSNKTNYPNYPDSSLTSNKSEVFQISNAPTGKSAREPQLVVDKDYNIHVVWADNTDGNFDILYRNFTYATQTWGSIINLTQETSSNCRYPSIAIDKDFNIFVIWLNDSANYSIYGRYYNALTSQWEPQEQIVDAQLERIYDPKIAWSGDNNFTLVYVITAEASDYKIYSKNYYPSRGWEADEVISENNVVDRYPDIYFDENFNGHLVFRRLKNGIYSIIYTNRTWDPFGGYLFEGDYKFGFGGHFVNITSKLSGTDTYKADKPSVVADVGTSKIYISWQDQWNSSGTYQLRSIGMTLTNYIDESLLDSSVRNITLDSQKHTGVLMAYGFNSGQVSLLWTEGSSSSTYGNLYLMKSFTDSKEKFNPSLGTPISTDYTMHDIANDNHNNLYVVYGENQGTSFQVMFRMYDVWDPQLNVLSPNDGLVWGQIKGNLSFSVSTEPDTKTVKYEYYLDDNNNGVDDDGNSWELIKEVYSTTNNFDYSWNSTENGLKDYPHTLIRVNATDINGLSSVVVLKNITIDNYSPQKSEIIRIEDNTGVKVDNSGGGDVYLSGVISVFFDVFDNCTGINYVELWNGTDLIDDNVTSGNTTAITIDTTIHPFMHDGNYSELKIIAYDYLGNKNISAVFTRNIIIDNTPPTGSFVDLIEGHQYKDSIWINVTTPDTDINTITLYYNKTDDPMVNGTIGGAVYNPTYSKWMKLWNLNPFSSNDGNYTIIAQIIDNGGFETNISIIINIDYTVPSPVIIEPSQEDTEVGTYTNIIVRSDIDTVRVDLLCSKSSDVNYTKRDEAYINESEVQGGYRIFYLVLYTLDLDAGEYYYIKINATDSIYTNITDPFRIKISSNRPGAARELSGYYIYNPSDKTYNITIFWKSPAIGQNANITNYYIYRVKYNKEIFAPSLNPFWLNSLTENEKKEYLGSVVGEKYFIYNMSVEELNATEEVIYNWTDTGLSARTYYYIILAVNILDYYSGINTVLEVAIPPEAPSINANKQLLQSIPILFAITVVMIAIMSAIFVKSARNRRYRRQTREKLEEMYEEKFSVKGETSFEERLDQIEEIAEISIKEETGSEVPEIEAKFAGESILDADISKVTRTEPTINKEKEEIGPRRCPHCNWIVSSTAVKCPRCQKPLY